MTTRPTGSQLIDTDPRLQQRLTELRARHGARSVADFTDLRSPCRSGHSRAVAALAARAGESCGLAPEDVSLLRRAALVHDVGIHGVPATILEKPGPLTSQNPNGCGCTPTTPSGCWPGHPRSPASARWRRSPERLDGSGYHRGLSGSAIPAAGRLLAAACAYQAMTEPRAYRPARTPRRRRRAPRRSPLRTPRRRRGRRRARRRRSTPEETCRGPAGLTPREIEVLTLISRGASNRQVAQRLAITPKTAEHPHRADLRQDRRVDPIDRDAVRHAARPSRVASSLSICRANAGRRAPSSPSLVSSAKAARGERCGDGRQSSHQLGHRAGRSREGHGCAFLVAVGAAESGRPTTLMFLTKEAVRLALAGVAVGVACDGCPPLADLLERFEAAGGRYYVCPLCFNAKKLDEAALIASAEIQGTIPMWEWIGDERDDLQLLRPRHHAHDPPRHRLPHPRRCRPTMCSTPSPTSHRLPDWNGAIAASRSSQPDRLDVGVAVGRRVCTPSVRTWHSRSDLEAFDPIRPMLRPTDPQSGGARCPSLRVVDLGRRQAIPTARSSLSSVNFIRTLSGGVCLLVRFDARRFAAPSFRTRSLRSKQRRRAPRSQ